MARAVQSAPTLRTLPHGLPCRANQPGPWQVLSEGEGETKKTRPVLQFGRL